MATSVRSGTSGTRSKKADNGDARKSHTVLREKFLTAPKYGPAHPALTPAKSKQPGCLSCPTLITIRGVEIGADYKGANQKQIDESKKTCKSHRMRGHGSKKPKVLIVLEKPSLQEDKDEETGTGRDAKIIWRMLDRVKLTQADVRVTYAVRCYSPGQTKETVIKACNAYLCQEIAKMDPDILVPVGAVALRACLGPTHSIESSAGNGFEQEVIGRKRIIFPLWSPAYVYVKDDLLPTWGTHFAKLALYAKDKLTVASGRGKYIHVTDALEAADMLDSIKDGQAAVDLETNTLDPHSTAVPVPKFKMFSDGTFEFFESEETEPAKIAIVSWATKPGTAYFVLRDHMESTWTDEDRRIFDGALKRLLLRSTVVKRFWNALFECTWFYAKYGIEVENFIDGMIEHHQQDEEGKHSLKDVASQHTGMGRWDDNINRIAKMFLYNYGAIPLKIIGPYAGADVDATIRLAKPLRKKLNKDQVRYVESFYPRLTRALAAMQAGGAAGDIDFARFYTKYTKLERDRAEEKILEMPQVQRFIRHSERKAKKTKKRFKFSLDSPIQLRTILYKYMNREPFKYTKAGLESTDKESLWKFAKKNQCHFSDTLLTFRANVKQYGTYAKVLRNRLRDNAGTIYGHYNVIGTHTGRLCVSPDTLIDTNLGRICISSLPAMLRKHKIFTISHTGKRVRIVDAFPKGRERMLIVRFSDGSFIKGTAGHRVFDKTVWKRLDAFRYGDVAQAGASFPVEETPGQIQQEGQQASISIRAGSDSRETLAVQCGCGCGPGVCVSENQSHTVDSFVQVLGGSWIPAGRQNNSFEAACSHCGREQERKAGRSSLSPFGGGVTRDVRGGNSIRDNGEEVEYVCLVCAEKPFEVWDGNAEEHSHSTKKNVCVLADVGDVVSRNQCCGKFGRVPQEPHDLLREDVPCLSRSCDDVASNGRDQEGRKLLPDSEVRELVSKLWGSDVRMDSLAERYSARETAVRANEEPSVLVRLRDSETSSVCGNRWGISPEAGRNTAGSSEREVREECSLAVVAYRTEKIGEASRRCGTGIAPTAVSIEDAGNEYVWDLTVDDPDHSYQAQGLFHHNSSNNPNLQNQNPRAQRIYVSRHRPRMKLRVFAKKLARLKGKDRSTIGQLVRSRFGKYGCLIALDYSQIEVRVGACVSRDKLLLSVYKQWQDVHTTTMCRIFDMTLDDVKRMKTEDPAELKRRRTIAKRVNFGVLYGIGPSGIQRILHTPPEMIEISEEEAAEYIRKFFKAYPGVRRWIDAVYGLMQRYGATVSPFGRIRHVPAAMGSGDTEEARIRISRAKRQGMNSIIQGCASDMTLTALCLIHEKLQKLGLRARLCLTVHDSIVVDSPIEEAEQVVRVAKHIMENLPKVASSIWGKDFDWSWVRCPIVAEAEIGLTWRDTYPYDPDGKNEDAAHTVEEALVGSAEKMLKNDSELWEKYKSLQAA